MTFAGDVPQGWTAQLMHGNFDRLAEGATDAARQARASLDASDQDQQFSILISCIGRRLLTGSEPVTKPRPRAPNSELTRSDSASIPTAKSRHTPNRAFASFTIRP
jgi:hypothetical protein